MNKAQAIHTFWSSFGLTAYDENTVPNNAKRPYITYQSLSSSYGDTVAMSASIWYEGSSWSAIESKTEEISRAITLGGRMFAFDDGAIWIRRGSPFAQRTGDDANDKIRRMYLNISVEFISEN